jgi:hypothetical protein
MMTPWLEPAEFGALDLDILKERLPAGPCGTSLPLGLSQCLALKRSLV